MVDNSGRCAWLVKVETPFPEGKLSAKLIFIYIYSTLRVLCEQPTNMAESDWDTVTVLRKKGPTAAQAKSKQVSANAVFRLCFRTFAD